MPLLRADARALPLADGCAQCVVTSPPYFGLRDYGAVGQIGLEASPVAYIAAIEAVFLELWRVLKADGTVWLNLGDSYAGGGSCGSAAALVGMQGSNRGSAAMIRPSLAHDVKPKDLLGIPWRVAFALQAAGWYLRSDIIWSKPNPMPERVTDRPTKAHEYIFLLAKQERYYYDADAVAEIGAGRELFGNSRRKGHCDQRQDNERQDMTPTLTRNKRSVWHVATQPYSGSHFATFPEALIEPCILAGSRPGDLVLDPFVGSGTVGVVCERYGRRWVGSDLGYQQLARARTKQQGLRFDGGDNAARRA